MLYEMLAGQPPTTADDPRVLILKVERGDVTPLVKAAPGIEPQLAGFVHRAMAPRPELRFANATEMRLLLEEIRTGKRAGTAKIAAAPLPAPSSPVLGEPADVRKDAGTGTVMGAPAPAALSHPALAGSLAPVGPGGTAAGPPLAPPPPMAQHPSAVMTFPQHEEIPRRAAKRGGAGVVVALAVVALLLGGGAVVAYVESTQPAAPVPIPLPMLPTTPTVTATTPATPATTSVTPVTPLTTSTVIPPGPGPAPAKRDGGGSQAQPDASAPPPWVQVDAGAGQTTIVTPFGTFQFPGPRPPFYPADQPWPPANIGPLTPPQ